MKWKKNKEAIKIEPRKKDFIDYAVPILGILLALFLSLHMAMSYEAVKDNPIVREYDDGNGGIAENKSFNYGEFFSDFGKRITETPSSIQWVKSSPIFLAGAGGLCLIIIGYFVTSRKKFINNKEYGTSEWGTSKQIAHLLAVNIKKTEIKNIKKEKISKHEKNKKISEAKLKYTDNSNIIFTQTEKICMYNFELNNNTMIIGGSGSGKTRGYVLPNILNCCNSRYSPSIVVTDPKGEIITKVGKYLESSGYVLKVLNLKEQKRSFCFNPFKYILEEKYEEQISSLVSSIMDSRSENKEQKSNDPFWEDMAKVLLKAIFYAAYEGFPMEERNMPIIMELFRWFEVSDNDDRYANPTKLDRFFDVFGDKNGTYHVAEVITEFYKVYYAEFIEQIEITSSLPLQMIQIREKIIIPAYSSDIGEIEEYKQEIKIITDALKAANLLSGKIEQLSNNVLNEIENYKKNRFEYYENDKKPIGVCIYEKYGDVNSNPALRNWEDFRTKCKGKTAQSVTATALAKLAPFDEEQIRRIFSKDEMELDLVGERKTALFIVLPPTNKTYNFIANVLYTMLFEQLEYCATVKHNQQLPVPVRFICDEFYNTGRIPNFENILSYARSFGIGISIILQSLDQIKEMYEKSWGTVLDNCSTFLYLGGIRHFDTLKYISDLLGKGTFDKKTYSQTKGRQSSSSTSFDKIGRELLDPAEIQRLNKKKCLLFVSGYQPYMSKKYNYKSHKNYKYTSDGNKKNLYYYKTPQDIEESQDNVTHGEEVKNVPIIPIPTEHGTKEKNQKTLPIVINTNEEEVLKILTDNVINFDLESGEEVALSANEEDELLIINELLKEEESKKETVSSIVKSIITPPIEVKTDAETIMHTTENMLDNIERINIVLPVDMGEESDLKDDNEWEDDTIVDLDNLENSLSGLLDDMVNNGFLDSLNSIDVNELEEGEVQDVGRETA